MITDADTHLAARFAAIRDETDDSDWNDVLRRRRPPRRPSARALVALAVVIAVGIPTALAFGAVRDFFFGTPAPPVIKSAFAGDNKMRALMLKWARAHHQKIMATPPIVNGAKAHGVIAVSTSDGPLALWAAPATGGKQCWFVGFENDQIGHRRATGAGGCDSATVPASKVDLGFGWSAEHPTLKVLSGRIYVNAVWLDVTATDNETHVTKTYRLPVVHSYFLGAFPRSLHSPKKVVARDAAGRIVLTFTTPR